MKKKIIAATAAALSLSALSLMPAYAAESDAVNVYVTISDDSGKLVLAQEKVEATDIDGDGKLTINDALFCAHELKFNGGAASGYASSETAYGLSLDKLWGVENGGSYGYYVNNASALSLGDEIKDGDYINAYAYTDLEGWSDKYCWFETDASDVSQGDEVEVKLLYAGFDENWAPVTAPVENAVITINGSASDVKTDAEGKAVIKLEKAGENLISASSDELVIVPPVLKINAAEAAEENAEETEEEEALPDAEEAEDAEEAPEEAADAEEESSDEADKEGSDGDVKVPEKPEQTTESPASSGNTSSVPPTGDNGAGAFLALAAVSAAAIYMSRKK